MRQNFDIVMNGGHRRLKSGKVRSLLIDAYQSEYQDDPDFELPRIDCQEIVIQEMNEV